MLFYLPIKAVSITAVVLLLSLVAERLDTRLAGMLADRGELDFGAVVKHFMEVNGCDEQVFRKHRDAAFATWNKRSAVEWKVDLGQYGNLIRGQEKSSR